MKPIVCFPDPILTTRCAPVQAWDDGLMELAKEMCSICYAVNGVGLAAPQVGVNLQLAVIVIDPEKPLIICNPKPLTHGDGSSLTNEACLSLPEARAKILRWHEVTVHYQDEHGEEKAVTGEGFLAQALQHETEHLAGMLFYRHIYPVYHRSKFVSNYFARQKEKSRMLAKGARAGR